MNGPADQPGFELNRLKELLLQPETERLEAVEERVGALDARVGANDRLERVTAEVLVGAFRQAEVARHRELADAVAPVVVAAIRSEIRNSKDMMVEALYPITGRLVAAAVSNAFRDLVADLNERIDRILSTRQWRLRFRSIVTGRPVSELALAEAQRPMLRRLLLLERGSGRLVASWHGDDEEDAQSELVSGLIAAITEFASSVYGAKSGELRTLDMGGARVFLRGAPVYLIAAECAGLLMPEHERELDAAFLSLVSRIDHAPADAQPAIADMAARLFQHAEEAKKSSTPLWFALAAVVCLGGWLASGPILRGMHERRVEASFEKALLARDDVAAYPLRVAVDHAERVVTISGLAPSRAAANALGEAIQAAAKPYAVATRVEPIGTLAQLDALRQRVDADAQGFRAQIAALEKAGRESVDNAFDRAVERAHAQTTAAARDLQTQSQAASEKLGALIAASTLPLRDKVAALLGRTAVFFSARDTLADPDLAAKRIDEIAAALKDNDFAVRIVGHADHSGGDRRNTVIAQSRADVVMGMLVARGVDAKRLTAVPRSSLLPIGAPGDLRDRRVTFELAYEDEKRP